MQYYRKFSEYKSRAEKLEKRVVCINRIVNLCTDEARQLYPSIKLTNADTPELYYTDEEAVSVAFRTLMAISCACKLFDAVELGCCMHPEDETLHLVLQSTRGEEAGEVTYSVCTPSVSRVSDADVVSPEAVAVQKAIEQLAQMAKTDRYLKAFGTSV